MLLMNDAEQKYVDGECSMQGIEGSLNYNADIDDQCMHGICNKLKAGHTKRPKTMMTQLRF